MLGFTSGILTEKTVAAFTTLSVVKEGNLPAGEWLDGPTPSAWNTSVDGTIGCQETILIKVQDCTTRFQYWQSIDSH